MNVQMSMTLLKLYVDGDVIPKIIASARDAGSEYYRRGAQLPE